MAIGLPLPPQERLRLEVDELVLRPWRENDVSKIAAAYQDDPEIPRRTGFAFEMTEEQAAGYIAKRRDGWRAGSTLAFGIFDASDRLLGSVSLLEIHRYELEAEVGYWVARQARGHGVAARAVELIARFAADLGLARLTATVEISNVASQRVLERAEFTREELVPKNRQLHGQWIDEYLYTRAI